MIVTSIFSMFGAILTYREREVKHMEKKISIDASGQCVAWVQRGKAQMARRTVMLTS